MATTPKFPLLQSPLLTNTTIRDHVELGCFYAQSGDAQKFRAGLAQILQGARGGRAPPLGTWGSDLYFVQAVFESLHEALIEGPDSLQGRIEAKTETRVTALERTWQELVGGESAEFNQMLERLIDQRLQQRQETAQAGLQDLVQDITTRRQEIRANPDQKIEIFRDAMQNLRRALPADDDPQRQAVLNQLIGQVAELGLEAIADQQ